MQNDDFMKRFRKAFDNATMAVIARRLGIPHATVRNYYQDGRLPAPEVLIKIAAVTGISLNWLLLGTGEMYATAHPSIGLGRFLEDKINDIVDKRFAELNGDSVQELGAIDGEFDVEGALKKYNDPQQVMNEWFAYEGRAYPQDYGVMFFRGWETFSDEDKTAALYDAKQMLDRVLRG
jgi:transcriptional regulator with XRE-family HTH domain